MPWRRDKPWQCRDAMMVVQTALSCPVTPWQCHNDTQTVNVTTRYSKNTVPPIANTAKTEPTALKSSPSHTTVIRWTINAVTWTLIILRAVTSCGRHGVVAASQHKLDRIGRQSRRRELCTYMKLLMHSETTRGKAIRSTMPPLPQRTCIAII